VQERLLPGLVPCRRKNEKNQYRTALFSVVGPAARSSRGGSSRQAASTETGTHREVVHAVQSGIHAGGNARCLGFQSSTGIFEDRAEGGEHERFYDLTGFNVMALVAEVRSMGRNRVLASIPGIYATDRPKDPVVFTFDGRDADGRLLPAGLYEITIRGRFVPEWMGLSRADNPQYHDLDGWNMVEEACRRPIRIEITEKDLDRDQTRGQSCAAPPSTYYDSVDASSSANLRSTLHDVIDDHTRYPYSSTSTDTWDVARAARGTASMSGPRASVFPKKAATAGFPTPTATTCMRPMRATIPAGATNPSIPAPAVPPTRPTPITVSEEEQTMSIGATGAPRRVETLQRPRISGNPGITARAISPVR